MPRDRQSGTQVQQENSLDIDIVRQALEPDYTILEELGRGGMAVVYRAKERALDREVAIKVLPSFMIMDKAFVERFQHEARTAGKLEHPNIVPIYRVGRRNRVIYFVMKLLRGQSLATVLRQRPKLTVLEVQRILIEVAGALGYAARRGVVHRDIKPDNILLDDEGRCVVTDFGIAKSSGGPLTAAGTSMGTPRYMSPEHARGIPLDGRSDMYSLGVVAYQCLTGRTPFDADDPFAILYKHINDPLPEPELSTSEEKEVYSVIEKMLAKDPEDRYQSADALITALGGTPATTTTTLITSRPHRISGLAPTELIFTPTLRSRLRDWSRDRRVWAGAGIAAVGLAAFALVPRFGFSPNAVPAPVVAGQSTNAAGAATKTANVGAGVPGAGNAAGLPQLAAGATTGAKALTAGTTTGARTTALTGAPTGVRRDTGTATTKGMTKIGSSTPLAARTSARDRQSKCPGVLPEGVPFVVLMDSIANKKENTKLIVNYDVCGLTPGAPVSTNFRLQKLNQRNPLARQGDRVVPYLEVLSGERSRRRYELDLAGLSRGDYRLSINVTDARARVRGATREFRIVR
jgi:serine/threonine protein kinase